MDTKYPRMVMLQQRALALVRIFIGVFFLYSVWGKLSPQWIAGFAHMMGGMLAAHPPSFYENFLRDFVLPNASACAYLVVLGELAVGFCLTFGLFTAPAALAGAVMNANYMLLTMPHGIAPVGLNLTFVVVQLALGLGYAGTTWGLDRYLVDKAPWWCLGFMHYEYREF